MTKNEPAKAPENGPEETGTLQCSRCHQTKPKEDFPSNPKTGKHYGVCKKCRGKAISAAFARRRERSLAERQTASRPRPQAREHTALLLDFSNHPEMLERIRAVARDEWRTPEHQIMYWLTRNMALADRKEAHR